MAKTQQFTAKQVSEALRSANGLVYLAAQKLGCHSDTVRNYRKRYPSVEQAATESKGTMIDVAEAKLMQAINSGQAWAICFFLKTQGKSRGYSERQEITGADGGPIELVETIVRTREEATAAVAAMGEASPIPGLQGKD